MKTILTLIFILWCGILWGNKSKVTVEYTRKEDKSIEFTYTKTDPGTLFIKFEFTELKKWQKKDKR